MDLASIFVCLLTIRRIERLLARPYHVSPNPQSFIITLTLFLAFTKQQSPMTLNAVKCITLHGCMRRSIRLK